MKTSKLNIVGNGFLAKKFKKYNAFFKKKIILFTWPASLIQMKRI